MSREKEVEALAEICTYFTQSKTKCVKGREMLLDMCVLVIKERHLWDRSATTINFSRSSNSLIFSPLLKFL